jgi:DNA-binding PadR family transcriptional regulator
LYPALLRLQQMGWITSKWGESENHRRARFYSITRAGKKQLATEAQNWERISGILARFVRQAGESS